MITDTTTPCSTAEIIETIHNTSTAGFFTFFLAPLFGKRVRVIDEIGSIIVLSLFRGKYYFVSFEKNEYDLDLGDKT